MERMEPAERNNLQRIAKGEKIGRKYEFINEGLVRRGYLVEKEGGVEIFARAFKHFVLRQSQLPAKRSSLVSRLFNRGTS